MRGRGRRNLVVLFVFAVFCIMFLSLIIMGALVMLALRLGTLPTGLYHISPLALMMVSSIILGSIISAVSGKKLMQPVRRLIWATNEVAKGNYNIRLETTDKSEFGDLIRSFDKMTKELSSVEIMRSDFVSSISHEFKTPIASIQGYATLLQDESLSADERREYTDAIISAAKQLTSLSGDILKLSKLETQEIVTEKTEFELDEQIRRVILLLEPGWSGKNIELDIDLPPVYCTGREELLQQVWLNLLDNAVKFTDPGGRIAVRLTSGERITVEIADNGIGMTDETMKHIFDKFYQGDRSRASEGNGLGLALVRRIVELSGGDVHAESKPGEGTVFTVRLGAEANVGA